jgi:hypothetical protein
MTLGFLCGFTHVFTHVATVLLILPINKKFPPTVGSGEYPPELSTCLLRSLHYFPFYFPFSLCLFWDDESS